MICSTIYRSVLSFTGSLIMTLGTFSMLQASAPWESPQSELVRYHNSDLTRPEKLYKRIHAAAERVCAPLDGYGVNAGHYTHKCIDEAVAAAVAEINHPQLSALHSATITRWQAASERRVKPGV